MGEIHEQNELIVSNVKIIEMAMWADVVCTSEVLKW